MRARSVSQEGSQVTINQTTKQERSFRYSKKLIIKILEFSQNLRINIEDQKENYLYKILKSIAQKIQFIEIFFLF